MTCDHDPVIMTERHGRDLRYRAECKYCDHNHGKWHVTQKAAMADWDEREQIPNERAGRANNPAGGE